MILIIILKDVYITSYCVSHISYKQNVEQQTNKQSTFNNND